nr:hypothetical protein [Jejubacter calystegiae]
MLFDEFRDLSRMFAIYGL